MNAQKIWQTVLGEMEVSLPKMQFATWFGGTSLEIEEKSATICCPNTFSEQWLKDKHSKQILETIKKISPEVETIDFKTKSNKNLARIVLEVHSNPLEKPVQPDKEPLSPLSGFNDNYIFDKLVVSNNNSLAYAVAQEVAQNPGKKHNPFFIYGGVGLGKTHLAQAVGHEVKKVNPRSKVFYVSCETFTNDFIAAISSKKMSEFKKTYRDVDVLIVDDVQFLSSKEGSQQEFFHTFNSLQQKSRQIILTADKTPQAIPALENRLASRFGGGMVVDIQPPDFETRIAILTEKCKEKGAYLPDDVINFLARNIVSNIRELEGALNRLIVHCQFNGQTPSVSVAETVLKDIISSTNKKVDTAEIISAVCKHYSLTKEDIVSGIRKKELIVPRQITVYLIREQTKKSLPEIGKIMGGKDHTTIMHSQKRIDQLIKIDAEIKRSVEQIREMIFKI